jgi:hypothetical protein
MKIVNIWLIEGKYLLAQLNYLPLDAVLTSKFAGWFAVWFSDNI